ncbi:hypothetical protein ABZ027_27300 [Streptomyces sp. NPDC006332]|uniref:hypothetical protein n=1 Tax=Streptomyces sp. NPDC006332 TaxID=3155456 RepID=UPI0033B505AA
MRTIRVKSSSRELSPLLAGAATAVAGCGALFAFADSHSPLRGPLTLFFLLATPAAAIAAGLRGLEPFGRLLTAVAGSVVLNMLVAQGMLAVHRWSVRGGLVAVTALSALVFLPFLVLRSRGAVRRRESQLADGKGAVTVKPTKR